MDEYDLLINNVRVSMGLLENGITGFYWVGVISCLINSFSILLYMYCLFLVTFERPSGLDI